MFIAAYIPMSSIALFGGAVFKKVTNGLSHVTCILTLSETQLGTSGAGLSL